MEAAYPDFVVDLDLLTAKAPYLIERDFTNWRKLNRAIAKSSSEPELTSYFFKTLSRLGQLLLRTIIEFKHSGNWNEYDHQKESIKDLSNGLIGIQINLSITNQKELIEYPNDLKQSLRAFFLAQGIDLELVFELKEILGEEEIITSKFESLKNDAYSSKVDYWLGFLDGNDPRKHIPILKDGEFGRIREYVLEFLIQDKIPENIDPVQRLNTDKGNIRWAFKQLFKECFPKREFSENLFTLYKAIFLPFKDDNIDNFMKQPRPKYFDDLMND